MKKHRTVFESLGYGQLVFGLALGISACGGESNRVPAGSAGSSTTAGGTDARGATSGASNVGGETNDAGGAAPGGSTSVAGGDSMPPTGGTGGAQIILPGPDPQKVPQCYEEPASGNCQDSTTRYYFDPASKKCKEFTYSGCGGNDNNFATNAECAAFCWGDRGCKCDGTNPQCKVVGACSECPLDVAVAEGEACMTAGLVCSQQGNSCTCTAGAGASPAWRCRIKAR